MSIVNYFKNKTDIEFIQNIEQMIPVLPRTFYNTKLANTDIFEILKKAQDNQINIKLQGPTGSGKTTFFEAYCEHTNQPHFISNMKGSTTSEELIGAFVPNEEKEGGHYVWKDGVVIRALLFSNKTIEIKGKIVKNKHIFNNIPDNIGIDIKKGKVNKEDIIEIKDNIIKVKGWPKCMLTIEEINFSPEELMSVWFSLLDIRRNIALNEKNGEVIKAGKFLSINATMNPDYIGTNQLNEALNDRFLIKLNVKYNNKIENKIINELGKKFNFDFDVIKFVRRFVTLIRTGHNEGSCENNISTRMIEGYLNIRGNFGEDVSKESLLNAFSEEDHEYVNDMFKLALSELDTIELTDEELDGINIKNFKGYIPKIEKDKTINIDKVPF